MTRSRFVPSNPAHFGYGSTVAPASFGGDSGSDNDSGDSAEALMFAASTAGQIAGAIVSGVSQNKLQQQQLAHEKRMTKLSAKYSDAEAKRLEQESALTSQQMKLAFGNIGKIALIGGSVVAVIGILGYTVIQLRKPAK